MTNLILSFHIPRPRNNDGRLSRHKTIRPWMLTDRGDRVNLGEYGRFGDENFWKWSIDLSPDTSPITTSSSKNLHIFYDIGDTTVPLATISIP